MMQATATNDFTHGRQQVRSGDLVRIAPADVNTFELRGLIEPGSAVEVDDLTELDDERNHIERTVGNHAKDTEARLQASAQGSANAKADQTPDNKKDPAPANKNGTAPGNKKR